MKKSYLLAFLIAVVAILWIGSKAFMPEEDAQVQNIEMSEVAENSKDSRPMQVRVKTLDPQDYTQKIIANGRSRASRSVTLRAETEGQVKSVIADEGQAISAGDEIVKIDVRERRERVNEAEELLKQRQIEFDASKKLSKQGYASDVRVAQTQSAYESALASYKRAQIDLEKTTIIAPFDGILGRRHVDVGDYLSVGNEISDIVDLDPLKVTVAVNEKEVVQIHQGDVATLNFAGGEIRQGVVSFIAPAADQESRTFQIDITMENVENPLPAGLTAQVEIAVAEQQAYQIEPSILTLNDKGDIGVKIIDQGGKVEFVPVTIIDDTSSLVWVTGIEGRARVVTIGQDFIVPGQVVEGVEGKP